MANITQAQHEFIVTLNAHIESLQVFERESILEDLIGDHLEECQLCHPLRDTPLVAQCIMDGDSWTQAKAKYGITIQELFTEVRYMQHLSVLVAKYESGEEEMIPFDLTAFFG